MTEESEADRIAAENKRKLEEHLAKLKRYKGRPPPEEPGEATGGEQPQAGAGARKGGAGDSPRPEPPRMDPLRREKWEAFKRLHGHRIHEIRPEELAKEADVEDYRALGVSPKASFPEVRQAFNRLAKAHHPDRGGDPEKFHTIRVAYERIRRKQGT